MKIAILLFFVLLLGYQIYLNLTDQPSVAVPVIQAPPVIPEVIPEANQAVVEVPEATVPKDSVPTEENTPATQLDEVIPESPDVASALLPPTPGEGPPSDLGSFRDVGSQAMGGGGSPDQGSNLNPSQEQPGKDSSQKTDKGS